MRDTYYWRRTDVWGLERLSLRASGEQVTAESTVLCTEDGGFRVDHRWRLDPDWRALALDVTRWGPDATVHLRLERAGRGWLVDGEPRPDLDGAEEPDLSVTPFCNTLPIRRMPAVAGATVTLDTCYVDASDMVVTRSRQRYERVSRSRIRYVDLGLFTGFEADLDVDDAGLVLTYEHLFERVG